MSISAKGQYYSLASISTRNGLSQNDVNCIWQDHQGFMWFGTNDGLNRYDGKTFKRFYKNRNGLSSGLVFCLTEDKHQNLWVATLDKGITRINLRTGKAEEQLTNNAQQRPLIDNNISSMVCDTAGTIWYACQKGIGKIERKNGKTQTQDVFLFEKDGVKHAKLQLDKQHKLWVFGQNNLGYLQDNQLIKAAESAVANKKIVKHAGVRLLVEGTCISYLIPNNTLKKGKLLECFQRSIINDALLDGEGNFWVGTREGLHKYRFVDTTQTFVRDAYFDANKRNLGLSHIDVRSLFIDNTGILYVGTYGEGVI